VVGLGNPGARYRDTRHNVGFHVAEILVGRWELARARDRFRAHVWEGRAGPFEGGGGGPGEPRVVILLPQTYMNEAGRSVGPARGTYRVPLERVLVVHDEIDLPFGEVRTRLGGGLAGHNGLKSVRAALGSEGFWRVRLGVGRPDSTDPDVVADYVLARFSESREEVGLLVLRAAVAAHDVVFGHGDSGTQPNSRPGPQNGNEPHSQ
jgi:PTH1 family peptidyl-tRNA hydrolase